MCVCCVCCVSVTQLSFSSTYVAQIYPPVQWRPESKGRPLFWIEQSEFLRLCVCVCVCVCCVSVCVCVVCLCVCVCVLCVCVHKVCVCVRVRVVYMCVCVCLSSFGCVAEVPRLLCSCTVHVVRWCDNL